MQTYTYEQARNFIKDGDVVFFKDKPNLSSKVIDAVTNSHYSHVAIAFWITVASTDVGKVQRLMLVESTGSTNTRSIINMSNDAKYNMTVLSAPMKWEDISGEALDRVGLVKYGWTDAVLIGAKSLWYRYTGLVVKTVDPKGEVCSEFVARAFKFKNTQISPQEVYDILISQYKCELKFEIKGVPG